MPGRRICVGAIAGAFGVNGEVRLKSFCAEPADIARYGPLSSEDGERQFVVTLTRPVKGGLAARLSGVKNRTQANALRGVRLYVDRAALPETADDEFYHSDLMGLPVHDPGGALIGKIKAVLNHGAGDILEIALVPSGIGLLPFTRTTVPTVDLAKGILIADPPDNWLAGK